MNLKELLQAYIDHRIEIVTRRTRFELEKAEARAHILEGLLIAVKNIDEIVKIIRESRTREEAGISLIKRFELSQKQTDAILEMRLHQLTGLAIEDIEKEYKEVQENIQYLKSLLENRQLLLNVIKEELEEVKNKYADERRTEITTDERDLNLADLIKRHSCVITVTKSGYIKRVPADTYDAQHRGGKGIKGMETKDEDVVEHLFNADSHDLIFFFTDKGFMHWLNVYDIPEGSRASKGKAIINMIKVEPGEKIRAMLTVPKSDMESEDKYLVMATRSAYIKKTCLSAFANLRRAGIRALVIEENDDLIGVAVTDGEKEIILSSALGMACRFSEKDIRPMGRTARGVTGMRFKISGDCVVSMEVVDDVEEAGDDEEAELKGGPELLVVSDGGMGKRSYVSTYRKTKRGAKGVLNIKLRPGEKVVGTLQIASGDEILVMTLNGQMVRVPIDEIRTVGRASKGVKIISLYEGDRITDVSKVIEVEEEKKGCDYSTDTTSSETSA